MPDMYDKLGEMLNEALESGKIPTDRHCEAEGRSKPANQNDQTTSDEKSEESGHFSFNKSEKSTVNNKESGKIKENSHCKADAFSHCEAENRSKSTGQVIKLHKYTYNMQFSPEIQKALSTLDIAHTFTIKDITKQYHRLLKENHPDTKKTIQISQSVQNIRQKTVDEITEAYKILCSFFSIK